MKKFIFILVPLIALAGFAAWDYYQTASVTLTKAEQNRAVNNLLGHPAIEPSEAPTGSQLYQDKYYSISYPQAASIYPRLKGDKPAPLELSYFAFQLPSPRLFFVITVDDSNGLRNVSRDSGASARLKDQSYKTSQLTQDGATGLVFEKTGDQNEETAYFLKSNRIYTFSVSGSDQEGMENLFTSVLGSLKFAP